MYSRLLRLSFSTAGRWTILIDIVNHRVATSSSIPCFIVYFTLNGTIIYRMNVSRVNVTSSSWAGSLPVGFLDMDEIIWYAHSRLSKFCWIKFYLSILSCPSIHPSTLYWSRLKSGLIHKQQYCTCGCSAEWTELWHEAELYCRTDRPRCLPLPAICNSIFL